MMNVEGSEQRVQRYLNQVIPLSLAMGVRVTRATLDHVKLSAPLAPNINHAETVFGGSAAALATLSAWTLLHLRLEDAQLNAKLVIQRSRMEYQKPIPGDFEAVCDFGDDAAWDRFRATLTRHGRARLTLNAHLVHLESRVASFEGDFVALG
jgi:thioesterase domain-containing protein